MSFDAIAPWYRTLETMAFRRDLQRCRVACLDELATPRRALIAGEGNGRFLCELVRRHPRLEIDCVDASARMLTLARHELGETHCVRFLQRDLTTWTAPEQHYDLIVTHFFLDCFPAQQLTGVVENLAHAATAGADWLLADFTIPPTAFARLRARAWLAVMYRFFQTVAAIEANELVDPSPFLRAVEFTLVRQQLFRRGMLKSELWRRRGSGSAGC